MKRRNIIDEVMGEHIPMPGCPQLIVTRSAAWRALSDMGHETDARKSRFGSVDYMVFSKKATTEPLSDVTFRDQAFAAMRDQDHEAPP